MRLALAIPFLVACAGSPEPVAEPAPRPPARPVPSPAPTAASSATLQATPASAGPAAPATAAPTQALAGHRLTLLRGERRILAKPRHGAEVLGVVRAGQILALREAEPYRGPDAERCERGWAALAPRGWLCPRDDVSEDPDQPEALAAREVLPNPGPVPYRYGRALGSPRYRRLPSAEERKRHERNPGAESPAAIATLPDASAQLLAFLREREGPLRHTTGAYGGMKLAFARQFVDDGTRWLVTPSLLLVPASAVKVAPTPTPRPVPIDALPLGRVLEDTTTFVVDGPRASKGPALRAGEQLPLADPPTVWRAGASYVALADGRLAPNGHVAVFQRRKRPAQAKPDAKWVHVSVMQGALIAYEGDVPSFGAVISPGMHGVTKDAEFRTPPGLYRVGAKWLTADMGGRLGQGNWRTREVPWVAYYDGSFALHGAWWHDAFGRPRSHGCVNLTPADAQRLFGWLEPTIPDGWYAVRADAKHRPGTLVLVTP